MSDLLRKLNEEGIRRFREYIRDGATGPAPTNLLSSPDTSNPLKTDIIVSKKSFTDRMQFGQYLNDVLKSLEPTEISGDQVFWTALALIWFDLLCPARADGTRTVGREYRYVLSRDYRHYYRHLVRSPWQLVRDHGENARLLLISPKESKHALSLHGDILEQFAGRQQVLASCPIIAAASKLYLDPDTGRPRTGVAARGAGAARRFGIVLRQLDLTYDPECMPEGALLGILPEEFNRWKAKSDSAAPDPPIAKTAPH